MKKNIIVVTGGAGFIGSSLIKYLIKKTDYKIISIDNYSSGSIKNHVRNIRVKYIRGNNSNINLFLKSYKKFLYFWDVKLDNLNLKFDTIFKYVTANAPDPIDGSHTFILDKRVSISLEKFWIWELLSKSKFPSNMKSYRCSLSILCKL